MRTDACLNTPSIDGHRTAECLVYVLSTGAFRYLVGSLRGLGKVAIRLRSVTCIDKLCELGWDLAADDSAYPAAIDTGDAAIIANVIQRGCKLDSVADVLLRGAFLEPERTTAIPALLMLLPKY
jgi:hypothetical protein